MAARSITAWLQHRKPTGCIDSLHITGAADTHTHARAHTTGRKLTTAYMLQVIEGPLPAPRKNI